MGLHLSRVRIIVLISMSVFNLHFQCDKIYFPSLSCHWNLCVCLYVCNVYILIRSAITIKSLIQIFTSLILKSLGLAELIWLRAIAFQKEFFPFIYITQKKSFGTWYHTLIILALKIPYFIWSIPSFNRKQILQHWEKLTNPKLILLYLFLQTP